MNERLAALLGVRKIIALLMTLTFIYLSVTKAISSNEFIPIFTMVVGYYYGKSTALDIQKKD